MNNPCILPRAICIYLTSYCYLKCKHCFLVENETLNKYQIDYDDIIRILDDAQKHNVFMIPITGGDPLLHPDCFKIINAIKKRNMMPLLGLSGMKITDDVVVKIKKAGVPNVQLSLDGPNEEVNAYYRGKNVFDEVLTSAEKIIQAGIKVNLSIVIDRNNINFLEEFLRLCLNKGIFKVKIAPRTPIPSKVEELKDILLNDEEVINLSARARAFEVANELSNWLVIAQNFKLKEKYEKPSGIIIFANGNIHISEYDDAIGNIKTNLPSEVFTNYYRS